MNFKELLKILSLLPFNYWYDFSLKVNGSDVEDIEVNLTDNFINFKGIGG